MCGVHDLEPCVHVALAHADFGADWGCEDFAAAAWEGVHASVFEFDEDPADLIYEGFSGGGEEVDELDELRWGECVDVDMGEAFADAVEEIEVPVE